MTTSKIEVIVVGTGGLAREFTSFFSQQLKILGYSTADKKEYEKYNLEGEVYSPDLDIELVSTNNLVLAIGSPFLKRELYTKYKKKGFIFPNIIHKNSMIVNSLSLEEGVIISPMCVIGPFVKIKKCAYINYQVGIGHDSFIGEYTQINPGSQLGGGTIIKGNSVIGSNSTLLQGTSLEKNIVVGSGSILVGKKSKLGTIAPSYSKYLPF